MKVKLLFSILLLSVLSSCQFPDKNSQKTLNLFADRTCRAIKIRKERFLIADEIRFTQDTLSLVKNNKELIRLKNKLDVLTKQKSKVLQSSLLLADTIRVGIDSLSTIHDKAAMKSFSVSLDSLLTKKGCKG